MCRLGKLLRHYWLRLRRCTEFGKMGDRGRIVALDGGLEITGRHVGYTNGLNFLILRHACRFGGLTLRNSRGNPTVCFWSPAMRAGLKGLQEFATAPDRARRNARG